MTEEPKVCALCGWVETDVSRQHNPLRQVLITDDYKIDPNYAKASLSYHEMRLIRKAGKGPQWVCLQRAKCDRRRYRGHKFS